MNVPDESAGLAPPAEVVRVNDKLVWMLILGPNDRYDGCKEVRLSDVPDGAVVLDHRPDNLSDGRFRWNRELARFDVDVVRTLEIGDTRAINVMTMEYLLGIRSDRETPPQIVERARVMEKQDPKFVAKKRREYRRVMAGA